MEPPNAAETSDSSRQPASARYFKLPDFWAASPVAWFGVIESQFRLRDITAEQDKFSLVASVLPEASARKIANLLANPPEDCYTALKAALLSSHQLTDIQKAERLFCMDNLGARRPMDLLAEMMELVKPGEEKTQLFAMLFLRRLPPHVRVQLTEDDHTDLRALAEKADRCNASFLHKTADNVAAVSAVTAGASDSVEEGLEQLHIAGIGGRGRGRGKGRTGKWQRGGKSKQQPHQQQEEGDTPADLARLSSGLGKPHFVYGSRAHSCHQPCSWQEN